MAIYISLNLALQLAEIYFKPTTWLKPCSDFGPKAYKGIIEDYNTFSF